jgi:hypothetical protein
LAVLAVVLGIANILLGFSEPGRPLDQQFVLLHLLTMAASGYLLIGWVLPFAIGRERADTDQRVAQVLASGPMLASAWCSARVGTVTFRGRCCASASTLVASRCSRS